MENLTYDCNGNLLSLRRYDHDEYTTLVGGYDPELGRWFVLDPAKQYVSPYVFGGNNPINGIEIDGRYFGSFIKWLMTSLHYGMEAVQEFVMNSRGIPTNQPTIFDPNGGLTNFCLPSPMPHGTFMDNFDRLVPKCELHV